MKSSTPRTKSSRQRHPLVLSWHEGKRPMPLRAIHGPTRDLMLGEQAPPWVDSGPIGTPFDFCGHLRRLSADIAARCEALRHLDQSRMLFAVTQARSQRAHGLQARVTPLRFHHGSLTRRRRGVLFQVQRYLVDEREMLYLVTFCLPRFLDLEFDEKMVTLFHELYHIGPQFDGDLRRHCGRYSIHSHSQKHYDHHMAELARRYLADGAAPELHAFLRLNFSQLRHRHGQVVGHCVPRPKLIPVDHLASCRRSIYPSG